MKYSSLALFLSMSLVAALPVQSPSLEISHEARALQPGEVIRLRVESSQDLSEVRALAFEKTFSFYEVEGPSSWEGLIGIDLDTAPGRHVITVKATDNQRRTLQREYPLQLEGKEFPTRRLTVEEKFVNPPAETLERIQRESRRVSGIFAGVTPQRLWQGSFSSPVPGAETSGFGKRSILNGQARSPHSGTDFRAPEGTPVKAPNSGRIVLVGDLYYSGNTVIIDHGLGLYSYFAHLSRFAAKEGDEVQEGDLLGYVGATGRVTGPHLHWTVRLVKTRVDPISLTSVLGRD